MAAICPPTATMTTRPDHRTLIAQLREWSAEQVAVLLQRRPDLAQPPPADLSDLAQRAHYQPSISAAVATTTLPENRLLQLIVCCRPDPSLDELERALPTGIGGDDIEEVLASLEALALVWRYDGRLHSSGSLAAVMPTPFGPRMKALATEQQRDALISIIHNVRAALASSGFDGELPRAAAGPVGRPPRKAELLAELEQLVSDSRIVAAILAVAPAPAAKLAWELLDGGRSVSWSYYWALSTTSRYYDDEPGFWLFRHGLLLPVPRTGQAVLPREVAVAMLGGRPVVDLALRRPDPAVGGVDTSDVDAVGAAHVVHTLDLLDELLSRWRGAPAKCLQSGGLGVAVSKQLANALDVEPATAEVLVELAWVAGLLDVTHTSRVERRKRVVESFVAPSAAADVWSSSPMPRRWRQLVEAWLGASYWPSASGRQDEGTKSIPLLSPQYHSEDAAARRLDVFGALAALDAGMATSPDRLAATVYWSRPQPWVRHGDPTRPIHWIWGEAELLGLVADGALTSSARALLVGDADGADAALEAAMPSAETTFTLQADLTATVVGRLARDVLVELRLLADVESTGAATTLRFSDASLRRALDAGRHADSILAFLERHAAKGVPQPLAYLVNDVARRHGHLRAGAAGSFVTSDDPGVLADACSHRRTRKLALRLIGPTVAVSPRPLEAVIDGLRDAGFLPVADDAAEAAAERPDNATVAIVAMAHPIEVQAMAHSDAASADRLPARFLAQRSQRVAPALDAVAARALAEGILAAPERTSSQFGIGRSVRSLPSRPATGSAASPELELFDAGHHNEDDVADGFSYDDDFDVTGIDELDGVPADFVPELASRRSSSRRRRRRR